MVTQEELSRMNPEEIARFQRETCLFCRIAEEQIPAKTVHSDDQSIAVLDINPASEGHMLLMPKEHYAIMPQIPPDLLKHLFVTCKGLSKAVLRATQCKGTTIFIANGGHAGQKAPHFMIHIIPRKEGDAAFPSITGKNVQKELQEKVKTELRNAFGKKAARPGTLETPSLVTERKKPKIAGKRAVKKKTERAKKTPKTGKAANKKFDLDVITDMFTK